jgi:hypothetical protein
LVAVPPLKKDAFMISRRELLIVSGVLSALGVSSQRSFGDPPPSPRPDPALFQAGDFVWPKKPGAFVPYDAGSARTVAEDQANWEAERQAYLDSLKSQGALDEIDQQRARVLSQMQYRDFLAVYEGDQKLGVPGAYSGSGFYVGHVGIIDIDSSGVPWVVEAVLREGVRKISYADWLAARSNEMVWLGRLRDLSNDQRAAVVAEAKKYIGKPYRFWNFDLNDDSGFYCSKLAWLATFRSEHFAVDGNAKPKRVLWFSPKQFLYCRTINRIHDPGPYAYQ